MSKIYQNTIKNVVTLARENWKKYTRTEFDEYRKQVNARASAEK